MVAQWIRFTNATGGRSCPIRRKRHTGLSAPAAPTTGKQGFDYFEGIAKETVGSTGLCLHLLTIPPGGRAKAHKHEHHETAIYVLSGTGHTWWGERLENVAIVKPGEILFSQLYS